MSTGGITAQRFAVREIVLGKMWDFLNDNFHKFTDDKKLKIAVALLTKDIPHQVDDSESQKPETKVVIIREERQNGYSGKEGDVPRPVSVIRV